MTLLQSESRVALPLVRRGKVREVYDLGSDLLIVATDRISAFDVVMANGIPDKGRVLTQMSHFWFRKFADICPHHVLGSSDEDLRAAVPELPDALLGRSIIARRTNPLPIECVARGYLTGSLYKEYLASGGSVHDLDLPDAMLDGSQLPEPIFTPATKAETGHDENISMAQAADMVGFECAQMVAEATLRIFSEASLHAASRGIILADTKFEFGLCDDGLLWIDEALTPDSSRFWNASEYHPGKAQPSYDKQFVRDYLESIQFGKQPPGPELPPDVVERTRAKYLEAYRLICGEDLAGVTQ